MAYLTGKIEVSVLCIPGFKNKLQDNFFLSGRTREWLDTSIINMIMENPVTEGVYAVTSNMDGDGSNGTPSFSMAKELKKFQEKYESNGGDIDSKAVLLKDQLNEIGNYALSTQLSSNYAERQANKSSAACICISGNEFTVTTMGDAKVFQYQEGILKQLTVSNHKKDHLTELGISANKDELDIGANSDIINYPKQVFASNDTYILCAGASTKYLTERRLSELLSTNRDTTTISSELLRQGVIENEQNDLSIMMIKMNDVHEGAGKSNVSPSFAKAAAAYAAEEKLDMLYDDDDDYEDEGINLSTIFATIFACIVALIIGLAIGYLVLPGILGGNAPIPADNQIAVVQTTEPTYNNNTVVTEQPTEQTNAVATEKPKATVKPTTKPTSKPFATAVTTKDTSTATTVDANGKKIYTVQKGDNLWTISDKFYGKYEEKKLLDANPGLEPTKMRVGQKIVIPD